MIIALKILAVVLLVLANGFFVASEFSMVGVRRMRIATLAEAGDRGARRVLALKDNLGTYISATQLGITLASLGLGWLGEPTVAQLLERPLSGLTEVWRHAIAFVVGFAVITAFHIVLGEQVPKMLGIERTERVVIFTSLPMQLFSKVFRLPIRALNWAGTRVIRLLGMHSTAEHAMIYTEDEIRQLVDLSHKSGHIEADEQQLINRVFDFAEAEVREAMVPRTAVSALPITATLEDAERAFCELGYSRLPVFRERFDDVVGVLFMKDIMPCLRREGSVEFDMERVLHPPLFVPAAARLGSVLAQMQSARTHLAFVVDEHGGIEGIVTLEDLLEEIVGEINDEYDEETRAQIAEQPDGTFLLDGMLAVRDANRRFKLKLPEEAGYTTLAGFMLARAGRILKPGETVEHEGATFAVERVDRHRIRRIRFTPAEETATDEELTSAAD
ncbi:MAG: magnesium and cobalt exporter, family [Acidobacteriota bacterium]|nr:magnesium and cobalt exporter, family [Acidobacteriota bacterium]